MPKGIYTTASRRNWTAEERFRVDELVSEGASPRRIARALKRSENAVHVYLARNVKVRAMRPMTARSVQRALGIGCAKTVARWIAAGWLSGRREGAAGPRVRHIVTEDGLLAFLASPEHWHRWSPATIADAALREWATEARTENYLTPGQVARRLCVTHAAVNQWIHRGFITARRHGNWWIPASALAGFVIPSERDRHGRAVRRFTAEDDSQLVAMRVAGNGWSAIGRALERHPAVIQGRYVRIASRATEVAA